MTSYILKLFFAILHVLNNLFIFLSDVQIHLNVVFSTSHIGSIGVKDLTIYFGVMYL